MNAQQLFLIEFNELCPSLLEKFMAQGHLPQFQKLFNQSQIFTTDAAEACPELEPWVQWPTVHNGRTYADHQIFHLGDGRKSPYSGVGKVLSDAGIRSGIFGSMNMNYERLKGYVIPDFWDKQGATYPKELTPFYRMVARQVQEASRNGTSMGREMLSFSWFMMRNGLTSGTIRAAGRQLAAERRDPGVKWRRAMILDRMQYDVFRCLNKRYRVQFASFACNSTAHFQHYYWRNMEPEKFLVPPPATDHPSLKKAILEGYQGMDRLIGRFLKDYPQATFMLATALSQQPWNETTKCTYRPKDFAEFLRFAQIPMGPECIRPVMAEQFHIECPTPEIADQTERNLRSLRLGQDPLMSLRRERNNLFTGCRFTDLAESSLEVTRSDGTPRKFHELFYMIHSMRSGRHHPDGVLWVRNGNHHVHTKKVPLTAIAPTILAHFGVAPPGSMTGQALPTGG